MKTRLVVATRENQDNFFYKTATGRSLSRILGRNGIELLLFTENKTGLPAIYNKAITESNSPDTNLIFAHDDVHFLDYFFAERIAAGLEIFDVIGLAGNKRRVDLQPAWAFTDLSMQWDKPEYLSGMVAHGKTYPPRQIDFYGPSRQQVKLLDGVLLAANAEKINKHALFFDERFDFHFYDMDFCRTAEQRDLRCGTWDIAIMHESGGQFGGGNWRKNYDLYIEKWER